MRRIDGTNPPLIPPVKKVTKGMRPDLDARRQNPNAAPSAQKGKPRSAFEDALTAAERDAVVPRAEATHATIEELLRQQGVILEDVDHPDAQE